MRIVKALLVGLVTALVVQGTVFGLTAQGYRSSSPIGPGLALVHKEGDAAEQQQVELATSSTSSRFAGISIAQKDATVATTNSGTNVYVVSEGEVTATVSDINGEVKEGDNLVLSPLKGVLMKAKPTETAAIGVALESQTDDNSTTEKVNNSGNSEYETRLSTVLVDINPKAIEPTAQRDSFLVLFGNSLTGKDVSALQVTAALIIFLLILIIEGSIIYGSIYSSIIALGRNPLSRSAVYKDLVQVTIIAIAILAAGLVAIYFILWA